MTNKKKGLIALCVVLVLAIVFGAAYFALRDKPVEGEKTITIEITHVDGATKTVEIETDAEYLRGALEQENLVQGDESEFGLFIKTVDGYTADDSKQEWWGYTKGGEYVETGVDTTVIEDGDVFEFTLNTGY